MPLYREVVSCVLGYHRPGASGKSVGASANFGGTQLKKIAQRPTKVAQVRRKHAKLIFFPGGGSSSLRGTVSLAPALGQGFPLL